MSWWVVWYNTDVSTGSSTGDTYKVISGTKAQAQAAANEAISGSVSGPYSTQAAATAAAKKSTGSKQQQSSNPVTAVKQDVSSAASGLLNWPTFQNLRGLMVRIAKVIIGGVAIIVGITMLAEKTTGVTPSQVASVASKAVLL